MAVIKRADAEKHLHRRVTLDLGDLERRGQVLREAAIAEAERIVREAHEERQRLVSTASEEGRRQGHAEGYEAGLAEGREAGKAESEAECRERLAEFEKSWIDALASFGREREHLLLGARRAVVELAVALAERVVHRRIETEPTLVEDQLRELLHFTAAPTTLVVRVHPEDEPLAAAVLPELCASLAQGTHATLERDGSLSRGSCVARALGGASIDATVETQLARLVQDLLPDRSEPPGTVEP